MKARFMGSALLVLAAIACSEDNDSGSGPGTQLTDKAAAVCTQMESLACAPSDCAADMTESIEESAGCESELSGVYDCVLQHPMTCDSLGELEFADECSGTLDTLDACIPQCSGSGSGNTCNMTCSGGKPAPWGVECTDDGTQVSCTCTSGAQTGKTFTSSGTCSDLPSWETNAQGQCS
jgi:hypothetical protein